REFPVPADGIPEEFFGNGYSADGVMLEPIIVGAAFGTWQRGASDTVSIQSATSPAAIPVETSYRLWNDPTHSNNIGVNRTFQFGSTPFAHAFRPYIPRFDLNRFPLVRYPNAAETALVAQVASQCDFGCTLTDWNGKWFVIVADPDGGSLAGQ